MSKSPTFEHRHYKAIAAIIADAKRVGFGEGQQSYIASWFADALKGTNPNYSRERFYAVAMGQPSNGRDRVRG